MAELVEVQRVVKIVLKMEMAPLVVPPALLENEPVGRTIGDKRKRGDTDRLGHRQLRGDIGRILTAVIPGGIAPGERIARSGKRRLHKTYKRKHEYGDYFLHREIHEAKDRKGKPRSEAGLTMNVGCSQWHD